MTVKELIAHLGQYPEDSLVLFQCCSALVVLEDGLDCNAITGPTLVFTQAGRREYEYYYAHQHEPNTVKPVMAICFPGN